MTELQIFQNFTISNSYFASLIKSIAGGERFVDLLLLSPGSYKNLQATEGSEADIEKIATAKGEAVLEVTIISHQPSFKISTKTPYKILVETDAGTEITMVFFGGNAFIWKSTFKEGNRYSVLCKLQKMGKMITAPHPKILKNIEKLKVEGSQLRARYPLSGNLTQEFLSNLINKTLEKLELLPEDWLNETEFLTLKEAIKLLHLPNSLEDTEKAKLRLAYDELLAKNLAFFIANYKFKDVKSPVIVLNQNFLSEVLGILPFALTEDQKEALDKILSIQQQTSQINILLQGDVGSGKTMVAILAALNAVKAGCQVAVMSPTFILAMQTFGSFSEICQNFGIETLFLSGEDKGKKRLKKLQQIASGEAKIIIGTHALFSADVKFQNLGYIIIDEQHRFGINQRLELTAKSEGAKTLLMTATPIPRTLSMALYGEIEIVYIKNKPKNRKSIITKLFSKEKLPEIIEAVKRKIALDERVYWVVPAIEQTEEETFSGTSIAERLEALKDVIDKNLISVIHGKMKDEEIKLEMEKFASGKTKLCLATTVIEVGVNVPSATLMVIECAESFGLAGLHQLRGRVGRGDLQSYCFLISSSKTEEVLNRLKIITNSDDGFFISEKDMEIRGSGVIFGKLQSGFEAFKFADFMQHKEIFKLTKEHAKNIINSDPKLETEEGTKLRNLLKFYNYDLSIDYFNI